MKGERDKNGVRTLAIAATAADETEMIRRVQAGDAPAFDGLVRRHLNRAFSVAYRVLGNQADAEDIVQESFLAALDHIGSFDLGRPFAPWLYRITLNRALSLLEARRGRHTESISEYLASGHESPLLAATRADLVTQLQGAIEALPERQRISIQLHEVDGFSTEEVAEMLGVSPGTVRWHIHQARRQLRRAMRSIHDDLGAEYG